MKKAEITNNTMTIITPTAANSYFINGKEVYEDSQNNWLSREDLTEEEHKDFMAFLQKKKKSKPSHSDLAAKELEEIKKKTASITKQLEILKSNENAPDQEKAGLIKYYESLLTSYDEIRNRIANNCTVEGAEIIA